MMSLAWSSWPRLAATPRTMSRAPLAHQCTFSGSTVASTVACCLNRALLARLTQDAPRTIDLSGRPSSRGVSAFAQMCHGAEVRTHNWCKGQGQSATGPRCLLTLKTRQDRRLSVVPITLAIVSDPSVAAGALLVHTTEPTSSALQNDRAARGFVSRPRELSAPHGTRK